MATIDFSKLTLTEVAKRKAPDGSLAPIVEALNWENPCLQDFLFKEANDTFSNLTVRRSQLPTGSWRKLNMGVAAEASKVTSVVDVIGILETRAENDVDVVNSAPDPREARNDEAMAFVEGLGQTVAGKFFYGNNATDPATFDGLAARMDALSATTNVIGGGGTGSTTTSIFVVDWGPTRTHMIYPKNSKVGLVHEDMGIDWAFDSSNNRFRAYIDWFQWKIGMAVKHPKSIARYVNIPVTTGVATFDEDILLRLCNRVTEGPGRRIYVNEDVMTAMEIRLKDKNNVYYTRKDGLAPGMDMFFKGVPLRKVSNMLLLNTETAIT